MKNEKFNEREIGLNEPLRQGQYEANTFATNTFG